MQRFFKGIRLSGNLAVLEFRDRRFAVERTSDGLVLLDELVQRIRMLVHESAGFELRTRLTYSILQGGLERFVKWDKPDFRGKAALQNEKQQGVTKRFVTLVVENPGDCDAPYMSTLWHGGKVVGETTSGNWGYRIGKSVALGMLRADLAEPGTEVEVEIFGDKYRAVVQQDKPLFDPENERLRA